MNDTSPEAAAQFERLLRERSGTLLSDVPENGFVGGQAGTVVELFDGAYKVEFSDDEGKTYALLASMLQAR